MLVGGDLALQMPHQNGGRHAPITISLKEVRESVIDARSQEAFEISHIPNARRAGYKDFSNEKIWSLNRKTMMVVYGEAAPESEFVAKKLQTLGFQNVYHLYGSITEWMNQKNEVVDKDGKKTNKLLFEDETRTKWLKKGKALTPKQLKK